MSKKMGRPRIDQESAKEVIKTQRFGEEESDVTKKAAKNADKGESTYIRDAALETARLERWCKSKFTQEEMDGQFIEFKLKSKQPEGIRVLEGVGELKVRKNNRNLLLVDIFINEYPTPYQGVTTRIWLAQDAVDRIELNPNPKPAKFRLLG